MTQNGRELQKLIQHLELSFLDPSMRQSKNQLDKLIADDFIEIGKSGKVYNKQNILDSLPSEEAKTISMIDFEVKKLSQDVYKQ